MVALLHTHDVRPVSMVLRMHLVSMVALGIALWTSPAAAVTSTATRQCVDPCIQAARATYRECLSSASGAFVDALGGCVERIPLCVDACRDEQQECRDATDLGSGLAACDADLAQARARCEARHPPGSIRFAICAYRARVEALRCRHRAARAVRSELRACRVAFRACVAGCPPGSPAGGVDGCRAAAREELDVAARDCRTTFRVTTGGCLGRDATCVLTCGDALDACNAAVQPALDAALAVCAANRTAGLGACAAANPDGGQALDDCLETVHANAFTCRQAAIDAAAPGFTACGTAYLGCVRACPPA